jgi:hypothetical protein
MLGSLTLFVSGLARNACLASPGRDPGNHGARLPRSAAGPSGRIGCDLAAAVSRFTYYLRTAAVIVVHHHGQIPDMDARLSMPTMAKVHGGSPSQPYGTPLRQVGMCRISGPHYRR